MLSSIAIRGLGLPIKGERPDINKTVLWNLSYSGSESLECTLVVQILAS